MPEARIALGLDDFRRLVSGRIIETEVGVRGTRVWIQIGLLDIGFENMTLALRDAIEGAAVDADRPADRIFNDIVEPGTRPAEDDESPTGGADAAPGEGEQP